MKLWYHDWATCWNEALPIGNGHLGGMIYGHPIQECVQLNDETIWYRGKTDRNNPDAFTHLNKIRQLLLEGQVKKAEELVALTMFATPRDQSHYESLGEWYIQHVDIEENEIRHYQRELELDNAVAAVSFETEKGSYRREYFASFYKNLLCCKVTTTASEGLNLNVTLGRQKRFADRFEQCGSDMIIMSGAAGGMNGVQFKVCCKAQSVEGDVQLLGETIVIRHAKEVVLWLGSITDYWQEFTKPQLEYRLGMFEELEVREELQHHLEKYREQFHRVDFQLGKTIASEASVTEMLKNCDQYQDELTQLLFHYGRYLLISSSQPGGLPSNLQGIWCEDLNPIWGSKYTININTQMNYWMVGPCDLPEVEYPLFDMLEKMREPGRVTARKMYGAKGFTAHHNTDGFQDTAPQSHAMGAAIWVMTVPWLCTHLWEHYLFFKDSKIVERYFSTVVEAFDFLEDYLFEVDGYLMTGPTVSPENKFRLPNGEEGNVCLSATIDNQILRRFCDTCIGMATVLGNREAFVLRVKQLQKKLPPTKIGQYGQIQEWFEDYEEVEPGHRHISPLFGLYPGIEIDAIETPTLAYAAQVTLNRRLAHANFLSADEREKAIANWKTSGLHASTQTGWSAAWLMHFFARLFDGNHAETELRGLLQYATLPNLFLDHPPFQIDGNLGIVSGICEMIVQSQQKALRILPALPSSWREGSVKGLRTRGGYKVSVTWTRGELTELLITNGVSGKSIPIEIGNIYSSHYRKVECTFDENGEIHLKGDE